MKTLHLLLISGVTSLFMMAFTARASTEYNFSYSFGSGGTFTGTLFGDQSGDYVINVTNVTVSGLMGPIRLARWDGLGAYVSLPPIVSFDATNNNFFFAGAAPQGGALWVDGIYRDEASYSAGVGGITQALVPQNWSLTPVPEPSSCLLLLLPFGFQAVRSLMRKSGVIASSP